MKKEAEKQTASVIYVEQHRRKYNETKWNEFVRRIGDGSGVSGAHQQQKQRQEKNKKQKQ